MSDTTITYDIVGQIEQELGISMLGGGVPKVYPPGSGAPVPKVYPPGSGAPVPKVYPPGSGAPVPKVYPPSSGGWSGTPAPSPPSSGGWSGTPALSPPSSGGWSGTPAPAEPGPMPGESSQAYGSDGTPYYGPAGAAVPARQGPRGVPHPVAPFSDTPAEPGSIPGGWSGTLAPFPLDVPSRRRRRHHHGVVGSEGGFPWRTSLIVGGCVAALAGGIAIFGRKR